LKLIKDLFLDIRTLKNTKSVRMLLIVFIITFITTIFIFLFLRFFYLQDQALDKTLSIFSGITTLSAAAIAAFLFNDWKIQYDYTEKIRILSEMLDVTDQIQNSLDDARTFPFISEIIFKKNISSNYSEIIENQKLKINKLFFLIIKLGKLEDKIYLLDNKNKSPIFKINANINPQIELLNIPRRLFEDINILEEMIQDSFSDNDNTINIELSDNLTIEIFGRLEKKGLYYLYLKSHRKLVNNFSYYNDKYDKFLNEIDELILQYRDKMDHRS
jgi:hypothetical protein